MKKVKLVVVFAVLALAFVLIVTSFASNLSPYLSVTELLEKRPYGSTVQVIGKVLPNTISFNTSSGILSFVITDNQSVVEVYHNGLVSNLGNSTEVVVIGKYGDDGIFYAQRILVKCPSKYVEKSEEEGGS